VTGKALESLIAHLPRSVADENDVAAVEQFVGRRLPSDYIGVLHRHDGAEGWIGDQYLALWPANEVIANNVTLETERLIPGNLLFATDGGGEAFGFDGRDAVVMVPLVGMSVDTVVKLGPTLGDWLVQLSLGSPSRSTAVRAEGIPPGHNVLDVHPVVLGGTPSAAENKAIVSRRDLLRIAKWWNERLDATRDDTVG
jgi:hypothetical protein